MNDRKIYDFLLCLLFLIFLCNLSGCREGKEESQANMSDKSNKRIMETEISVISEIETDIKKLPQKEVSGDIFYWGAEEYFHLFEGEWIATEYVGSISDYHFDETRDEKYQEKMQEYVSVVTEKYLESEYCVDINNLVYFGPYVDLDFVMENNDDLFFVTRFIPGEFITITPPYIGVSVYLADKDKTYQFIIDSKGTVLIEIDYCFFRLDRK